MFFLVPTHNSLFNTSDNELSEISALLMHQSIPAVPIPPGQPRGICYVVSPGGGALVNFIVARGLGISIPRGEPLAFDTRVFERWMSLSRRTRP